MQDQVEALWRLGYDAAMVNSSQSQAENNLALQRWGRGELQFLLVAPERITNKVFRTAVDKMRPDQIVVDEAHCVSQWSDNFRPDYLKIKDLAEEVSPKVVVALSATMTGEVESDVRNQLGIPDAHRVMYYPPRENLSFEFHNFSYFALRDVIDSIKGPTIVYCPTKKQTHEYFQRYKDEIEGGCLVYNGGMKQHERTSNQNQFMSNDVRVMFATNAFGMGVNKPDIRGVIHVGYPANIEQYVQEAGRAGRDGAASRCVLLGDAKSITTQEYFIENGYPSESDIRAVFRSLKAAQVNGGDNIKMTINDMSKASGVSQGLVTSAFQIMVGSKVITRTDDPAKAASIKFLKDPETPMYKSIYSQIESIGFSVGGFWEFNFDHLCEVLGKKPQLLGQNLNKLAKDQAAIYVPPFRGKVTQIIGEVDMVDFARVARSRKEAYEKLDQLKHFCRLDNESKHSYLTEYFS